MHFENTTHTAMETQQIIKCIPYKFPFVKTKRAGIFQHPHQLSQCLASTLMKAVLKYMH